MLPGQWHSRAPAPGTRVVKRHIELSSRPQRSAEPGPRLRLAASSMNESRQAPTKMGSPVQARGVSQEGSPGLTTFCRTLWSADAPLRLKKESSIRPVPCGSVRQRWRDESAHSVLHTGLARSFAILKKKETPRPCLAAGSPLGESQGTNKKAKTPRRSLHYGWRMPAGPFLPCGVCRG